MQSLFFFFDEADLSTPYGTCVVLPKLRFGETETAGEGGDLLIADPHGAGESTAAAPAPQALKAQAVFVPEICPHEKIVLVREDLR